jgi:hypothetical protein
MNNINQRFLESFKKSKNGCWIWQKALSFGYGIFCYNYKRERAHRYSYRYFKGNIPKNKVIDHLCNNPSCVNPKHLEAVYQRENVLRGVGLCSINHLKKKCKRGHLFNKENTYKYIYDGLPRRKCKSCNHLKYLLRSGQIFHLN